jgi:hypothetical protein
METPAVVLVQPLFLLAEHVLQHHARLDRHARQPLEAVPAFIRVGVLGLYTAHDEDGLDANTKFIRFVYRPTINSSTQDIQLGTCRAL